LEGVEQPKKWPKNPGNALSNTLLMSRFQNLAADTARKKIETALRAVLIHSSIRDNSGPKILISRFSLVVCRLPCSCLDEISRPTLFAQEICPNPR